MSGRLTWSTTPTGLVAVDAAHKVRVHIVKVTDDDWDVWVFDLFCGTYLTREMVMGAAVGLYRIRVDGSSLPRWAYPGRG